MRSSVLIKILAVGALGAAMTACVAVDDPYYQGGGYGYGGGYGGGYPGGYATTTYTTYTSYPAYQGAGYYADGGYYTYNPGIAGAIYIRDRDDWRARDNARRSDWERRRDQARRDDERRREQARRDQNRNNNNNWNNNWNNNNRPTPMPVPPGYNNNPNRPDIAAERNFQRGEYQERRREQQLLNSSNPNVNRMRAEQFERDRRTREDNFRRQQNGQPPRQQEQTGGG